MVSPPNANGHRRRQLVKRVKAEEHNCALCDLPVDPTLNYLPGQHGRVCPRADCRGCIPDPNSGEGWYEWHKMPQNTTHIAYVHENGSVYLPEGDADQSDFLLASARGHVHRAVWLRTWRAFLGWALSRGDVRG